MDLRPVRWTIKQEGSQALQGPILISSRSPSPSPRSCKRSRDRLFAALENGNPLLREPRTVTTADDLEELELKRCFEILHACGIATDPNTALASTRDTMEGFLDAVFNGWAGNTPDELPRPSMDFTVREYVSVGNICDQPANHRTSRSCEVPACSTPVYVIATYRSRPAQLETGFCIDVPPGNDSDDDDELFCPMERTDIRWDAGDWMGALKAEMKRSCTGKIHKYNKHLAVWNARRLVRDWARGSISMGEDRDVLAFVGRESVDATFATMGDGT
ncbi:hypothetical protein FZEAL_2315 [Fusarium zealandicum]|uniref:Uncharacterized protein n=1 Tax=Fusarium zealandicum TaxID=1053134 RepID=A0A8H4UR32_9HYPO|nr:hypothetical protein FZEAL_2315 [Fusarium zealandicum]